MTDDDTIITLIGTRLAKIGCEFIYRGPADDCESCRIKNVCLNLRKGTKYRIVNLRPGVVHDCAVHEGGVKTVEVVETPVIANVDARKAIKGSKIVYSPPKCVHRKCSMRDACMPEGMQDGDRYLITEVIGALPEECAEGYTLNVVELKR